ncbi:MAG: AsmA family protein [Phycisphaerales bacterium]|nr:AsmA family protein [Planctomycetota bacterium]
MKRLRKLLKYAVPGLFLAALCAGIALFLYLRSGSGRLETWLGKQLVGIASSYIEPTIEFKRVRYTYPGTVVFTDVTFTARDKTRVVSLDRMTVTLAEIPAIGAPLKIERIELEKPLINLIATPEGGFKGLVPFVRNVPGKESAQVSSEFKLSNVLRLRKLILKNGTIHYEAGAKQPVMVLDGISTDMDIKPAPSKVTEGLYALAVNAGKAPGVEVKVKGLVNVDTYVAEVQDATLDVVLDEKTMEGLPPQLQTTLRAAEARGKLGMQFRGTVPTLNWRSSEIQGQITIADFNVAAGRFKFPIDHGIVPMQVAGGSANLSPIKIDLLAGQLHSNIAVNLSDPSMPMRGDWQAVNLNLEKLMRAQQDVNAPPGFQGSFNSTGNFAMSAGAGTPQAILATSSGGGNVTVRDGRLFVVPGLMDAMNLATGHKVNALDDATKHSLDGDFLITGQGLEVTQSHIVAGALDARATGLIGWDLSLNMQATANPIAAVTQPFGAVGRFIGNMTKEVIQYQIKGNVGSPEVSVRPFGIGGK